MALIVADRVQETTNTTGTGTLTLAGAVSGYQSFGAIGDANTTYYTIVSGTNWETGIGTYTASGTTLSRNTVLASSAGGTTKISVVSGAVVFVDYPAGKAVYEDETGVVTGYPISGGTINNTVIGGTTPAAGTFTTITGQTGNITGTGQNLLRYSQLVGSTGWGLRGTATATANTAVAPDSTTTASTISNATDLVYLGNNTDQNIASNVSPSTTYTFSCYVKFGTATTCGLYIRDNATGNIPTTTTTSASGWTRISVAMTTGVSTTSVTLGVGGANGTFFAWGAQLNVGATAGNYVVTTSTPVLGLPAITIGTATIGTDSSNALYLQPSSSSALQAQATTSTATGGNARGANAVDWQTARGGASQVASGGNSTVGGGQSNQASGPWTTVAGGRNNTANTNDAVVAGGNTNVAGGGTPNAQFVGGGTTNTAGGWYNVVVGGVSNSGTSVSVVTTNTTTIAVTAGTTFYLSATNANIKVGQYITGTGVSGSTYATSTVTTGTAAVMNTSTISGTTLTVGSLASGTIIAGMVLTGTGVTAGTYIVSGSGLSWVVSTSQTVASTTITGTAYTFTISQNATTAAGVTLSFYTPHGVVVGGGNNQATGSYSFIGGGGDAGTAGNRNTASGDWSVVVGGYKNTASALQSFIGGGFQNTAGPGNSAVVVGGAFNIASGTSAFIGNGSSNQATGAFSFIGSGVLGTTRSIIGYHAFPACNFPVANLLGASQAGLLVLGRQTTDATATVLTADSSVAGTGNQVILPNNSAYTYKATGISTAQFVLTTTATAGAAGTATITFATQTVAPFIVGQSIVVAGVTPTGFNGTQIVTACTTTTVQYANATTGAQTVAGTVTGTSFTSSWKIEGAIMRSSSAAGTRLVGSPTTTVLAQDTQASAWTLVASADTTNGGLKFTFTGAAGTTIRTVVKVDTTEVTY